MAFIYNSFIFIFENLKNKYLALIISYPYFIVVVGMGPIRQSAAIGFLCYILMKNKNSIFHLFFQYFYIIQQYFYWFISF